MLAVDAGQTATRARLVGGGGVEGIGPGVRHLRAPGALDEVVDAVLAASGGMRELEIVCLGLSGFSPGAPELAPLGEALAEAFDAARVVIASDAVAAHLGALRGRPGVVVAAGTGSVVVAADGEGAVAIVDGWGHLLGDRGSGFAIGRAGLSSALGFDAGIDGSPMLAARAEAAFGPLAELPAAVYATPSPARSVAAFAPAVADAAREGDEEARAIWTAAAEDLAACAAAAAQGVLTAGEVCGVGALFAVEDLLRAPFLARLAELAPDLRPVAPAGNALDGAALLAHGRFRAMFPDWVWTG